MPRIGVIALALSLLLADLVRLAAAGPSEAPAEIVLLMDDSGSMKRNDPQRARIHAAQLFVSLLPYGTRVGLVRFSTDAREAFPPRTIEDEAVRASVRSALDAIGQSGQWTDIGQGVERALASVSNTPGHECFILLFTDGEVDVPGGAAAVAEARRRLRASVIPRCQQARVRLYALAFTANADQSLLREMAEAANGAFYQGDDPKFLHALFTQMFERLAEPQGIPIEGQQVVFDPAVQEATFVITRRDNSAPLSLQSPDGRPLRADNIQADPSARWFQAPEFDVVTVAHPAPGLWRISPPPGPEDRVHVVTDLELAFDPLPGFVNCGQELNLRAWLQNKNGVVNQADLLSTIVFQAELAAPDEVVKTQLNPLGDGVYGASLACAQEEGACRLRLSALGKTLQRTRGVDFSVRRQALDASLEETEGLPGRPIVINAELKAEPERFRRLEVLATITAPDGEQKELSILPVAPRLYASAFPETAQQGRYAVAVRVDGEDLNGQRFETSDGPFEYLAASAQIAAAPAAQPPPSPVSKEPPQARPPETPQPERSPSGSLPAAVEAPLASPAKVEAKAAKSEWGLIAAFGLAHLILCAGGFALWWRCRSHSAPSPTLEERLKQVAQEARERLGAGQPQTADIPVAQGQPMIERLHGAPKPIPPQPELPKHPAETAEPSVQAPEAKIAAAGATETSEAQESAKAAPVHETVGEAPSAVESRAAAEQNSQRDLGEDTLLEPPEGSGGLDLTPPQLETALRKATRKEELAVGLRTA